MDNYAEIKLDFKDTCYNLIKDKFKQKISYKEESI